MATTTVRLMIDFLTNPFVVFDESAEVLSV